jgi:DNA mismatch repair ATPase MutS
MDIEKIQERQIAVQDLMDLSYENDVIRAKMGKLPDLEKMIARLYTYSIKSKIKAVYFENVSLNKLKEFRTLIRTFYNFP